MCSVLSHMRSDSPTCHQQEVHSGHFMVSNLDDSESEVEETDFSSTDDDVKDRPVPVKAEPIANNGKQSSVGPFEELGSLFKYLEIACTGKLTSPKWNRFRGLRFPLRNTIRINNIIWREYHMQFVKYLKPYAVYFQPPSAEKPVVTEFFQQTSLLEGKYWIRRMNSIRIEYSGWRLFGRSRIFALKLKRKTIADLLGPPYPFPRFTENIQDLLSPGVLDATLASFMNDNMMDFDENIDLLFEKPFNMPLSLLDSGDLLQPGFTRFEPDDIDEPMLDQSNYSMRDTLRTPTPNERTTPLKRSESSILSTDVPPHIMGNVSNTVFEPSTTSFSVAPVPRHILITPNILPSQTTHLPTPAGPISGSDYRDVLEMDKPIMQHGPIGRWDRHGGSLRGHQKPMHQQHAGISRRVLVSRRHRSTPLGKHRWNPSYVTTPSDRSLKNKFRVNYFDSSGLDHDHPDLVEDSSTSRILLERKSLTRHSFPDCKLAHTMKNIKQNTPLAPLLVSSLTTALPAKFSQTPSNPFVTHASCDTSNADLYPTAPAVVSLPGNRSHGHICQSQASQRITQTRTSLGRGAPGEPAQVVFNDAPRVVAVRADNYAVADDSNPCSSLSAYSPSGQTDFTNLRDPRLLQTDVPSTFFISNQCPRSLPAQVSTSERSARSNRTCKIRANSGSLAIDRESHPHSMPFGRPWSNTDVRTGSTFSSDDIRTGHSSCHVPYARFFIPHNETSNETPSEQGLPDVPSMPDGPRQPGDTFANRGRSNSLNSLFTATQQPAIAHTADLKLTGTLSNNGGSMELLPSCVSNPSYLPYTPPFCSPPVREVDLTPAIVATAGHTSEERRRQSMQASLQVLRQLVRTYSATNNIASWSHQMDSKQQEQTAQCSEVPNDEPLMTPGGSHEQHSSAGIGRYSHAAILRESSELIKGLREVIVKLDAKRTALSNEISSLESANATYWEQLSPSGVSPSGRSISEPQLPPHISTWFAQFVNQRTQSCWQFYPFSLFLEELFESYYTTVSTASQEHLVRSLHRWTDQHCSAAQLRPALVKALCKLATTTSALSDFSQLPEQARQAAAERLAREQNRSNTQGDPH